MKILYKKKALKDIDKLKAAGLAAKAQTLIDIIRDNPFQTPPPYEHLFGEDGGIVLTPDQPQAPLGL